MTIRTSLFPMGYRQEGSPQPTGDTPGNLLGTAYCIDDGSAVTCTRINGVPHLVIDIDPYTYRYDIDLNDYINSTDTLVNLYPDPYFPSIFDDLSFTTGFGAELYIKTPADRDLDIYERSESMGMEPFYFHMPRTLEKDSTYRVELIGYKVDSQHYGVVVYYTAKITKI